MGRDASALLLQQRLFLADVLGQQGLYAELDEGNIYECLIEGYKHEEVAESAMHPSIEKRLTELGFVLE